MTDKTAQSYNGYANHETWEVANYISNDPHLYDLCKQFYESGYKTWGSLSLKLREYGRHWQSVNNPIRIDLRDPHVRAAEITNLLNSLFHETKQNHQR